MGDPVNASSALPPPNYPSYIRPQQNKPWYKRKRVILPTLLLLLGGIGAVNGDGKEPAQSATTTSSSTSPAVTA